MGKAWGGQRFLCLIGLSLLHVGLVPEVAQKSPHVRCRSCAQRYIWPGACEPLYPPYKPYCPGLGHALPQDGGPVILPEMIDFKGFRVYTALPTKRYRDSQGACHTACWVVNNTEISYMGTADSRQYLLCRAMNAALARRPAQAKRVWDEVSFALHCSRFACTLSGFGPSIHRSQSIADSLGSYPRGRESQ